MRPARVVPRDGGGGGSVAAAAHRVWSVLPRVWPARRQLRLPAREARSTTAEWSRHQRRRTRSRWPGLQVPIFFLQYNNIINSLNLGPGLININRVLFDYYNKLSDVRPQYLLAFVEQHYLSTAPLIKNTFKVIDLGRRRKTAFSHASTLRRISHRNIVVI